MTSDGAYGRNLANTFHLMEAPSFISKSLRDSLIAVTKIVCNVANNGLTTPIPRQDALLVTLQLRDCPAHDLWIDGKSIKTGPLTAGSICIYDLRQNPVVNSISPFQNLHFFLPRTALESVSEGFRLPDSLPHNPGIGETDPVMHNLGMSLLPSFDHQLNEVSALFANHVTTAVAAYVSRLFISNRNSARPYRLAQWQMNRVNELLIPDSGVPITIAHLARECDLPLQEFLREFRHSTGMRPHQWMLKARLELAKDLLARNVAMSDVVTECDFPSETYLARLLRHQS